MDNDDKSTYDKLLEDAVNRGKQLRHDIKNSKHGLLRK